MAVTRDGQVIQFTEQDDAITGLTRVIGFAFSHTGAAAVTIQNTAGMAAAYLKTTSSILVDRVMFDECMIINGLKIPALTTGAILLIYIE